MTARRRFFNDLRTAEGLLNTWCAALIVAPERDSGLKMTWRIDREVVGDDIVALCISGRITKQNVDALRSAIEDEAKAVAIDLRNVVLVDRDAVEFLAQTELDGTELRNCPPYIREWVTRERAESKETGGDIADA